MPSTHATTSASSRLLGRAHHVIGRHRIADLDAVIGEQREDPVELLDALLGRRRPLVDERLALTRQHVAHAGDRRLVARGFGDGVHVGDGWGIDI